MQPAPVTKPAPNSLKKALAALIAECKQQGETMVFEIRCETIAAIRAAL